METKIREALEKWKMQEMTSAAFMNLYNGEIESALDKADGQGVEDVIKSSKPGSPLIRRSVDVDGNKVVILAEWFYEELAALKGAEE